MSIKKACVYFWGLLFLTLPVLASDVTAPAAITDLSVSTGTAAGSLILRWSAPADDTFSESVNRYFIRYLTNGPISSESSFSSASRLDLPPLSRVSPTPSAPNSLQTMTITGLTTGVTYYFAIRSGDEASPPNMSLISNSVGKMPTEFCGATGSDGEGSAAISPLFFPTGGITELDITYTVGASGIQPGGKVQIRVPDYWVDPQDDYSNSYGYVELSYGGSATLFLTVSGKSIEVEVGEGLPLTNSETFIIKYHGSTCNSGVTSKFPTYSQAGRCGSLREINFSPSVQTTDGPAAFLSFETYDIPILINTTTPIKIYSADQCGHQVPISSNVNATLSALKYQSPNFVADSAATLSMNSDLSSPFASASGVVPFTTGQSSTTIYYKLTSTANASNTKLQLQYNDFANSYPINYLVNVIPLIEGITNLSVDNGTLIANQTSANLSPDNDGSNDNTFINFKFPSSLSWKVELSSTNFVNKVRTIYGYGSTGRVSWDGFTDGFNGPPNIAPPATYKVRVSDYSNFIKDESLTIVLSGNGVIGRVLKSDHITPLVDTEIEITGPSQRFTRTLPDGSYSLFGLRTGSYKLRARKTGYSYKEIDLTLSAGITTVADIELTQESLLRIMVTRPDIGNLPEIWGNVRANNSNWSRQAYGTIHFRQGQTVSDAGNFWDVNVTTYTDLTLTPTVEYKVHLDIPSHTDNGGDFTVTLNDQEIRPINRTLSRRANFYGNVAIPAGSNTNGTFVSIEVGRDSNQDLNFDSQDPSNRRYGGVWIPAGETEGTYYVYGVETGTYLIAGRAPGFIIDKKTGIISGTTDVEVNFSTFSQGGGFTGTITINGDTTSLDMNDGQSNSQFPINLNAWSPTTFVGSYSQFSLPINASQTSGPYELKGLENGTYDVYVHLPGFETVPPGPKTVTVTGGTGTLNLTFNQFTGSLTGTITLPGNAVDYNNVDLELISFGFDRNQLPTAVVSGNTFTFSGVGTGFYTLRAVYETNGFVLERSVQIANGQQTTSNISLTGNTYTISGKVTSNANAPYTIPYLVGLTTATLLYDTSRSTGVVKGANRIVAQRFQNNRSGGPMDQGYPSGFTQPYDSKTTYFGFYDSNGDYSIPNLSQGVYRLSNNGQMDNNATNGKELAESFQFVYLDEDKTIDIAITNGQTVSGSLKVMSGQAESGRQIEIFLQNSNEESVARTSVFLTGTSANFSIASIPPGDYLLRAQDFSSPVKYTAKDVRVQVDSAEVSGKEIQLLQAARIQGQLRIATSGELITSVNYQRILPTGFSIFARSNPWFPGGFGHSEFPMIDSNGMFNVAVGEGTFDLSLISSGFIGDSAIAEGKKQFVPITVSGIQVTAGQTKNLGVLDLEEGIRISGTVTDTNNNPLPNIIVEAEPSLEESDMSTIVTTNHLGQFTIHGIDSQKVRYYDIKAAPRPDQRNSQVPTDMQGTLYGEVLKAQVDTRETTTVNFVLEQALGSVTGRAVTPDGGRLLNALNDIEVPGATVIMNKHGNTAQDNPLGDIEAETEPSGEFTIKGLTPGSYDLWVLAEGYASGFLKNIEVTNSNRNIGDVTVIAGNKLTGTLLKPDGTAPNEEEISDIVAVRDGFRDLIIGKLETDASGSITKYSISGFQANKSYAVLLFNEDDDIITLTNDITVNNTEQEQNFVLTDQAPAVLSQALKDDNGDITVQFELTRSMRNSEIDLNPLNGIADDYDLENLITIDSGAGTLSFPVDAISSNRRRIKATYTPAAGETTFTLSASITFNSLNSSGENHVFTGDFTFYNGIGNSITNRITNVSGGRVKLVNDPSEFSSQPGTFGDSADLAVEVTFRAADSVTTLTSAQTPLGSSVMMQANRMGMKAYPQEMAGALVKAQAAEINPFSSFYDIFLPAGVSHFFPEGKEASLCLLYDDAATDPQALNIYYYNSQTNEYLLENNNRTVDTVNKRICVSIGHASVFTVLASSVSIISGDGYTGELALKNFPNPFNLKPKNVTLQNPGSASATQSIEGTMIKMSVPASMSGTVEIQIFSVTGELVRTLRNSVTGGSHYYMEWDGKNENGQKVASGTYIARFTLGGGNEKMFKMAVLK